MSSTFTQVSLSPSAGFCIKSTTLEPGLLLPPITSTPSITQAAPGGLLEPKAQPIPVPKGLKIFVNICYDKNVPPPPDGTEESIQRAIKGDSVAAFEGGTGEQEEEWYVPVVVSEPRLDKDKAGKESLVVDCVYHSEVRKRTLRDPEFKVFLVELGLQRIEAQTGLTLSRSIGTPNIAAKGKLEPRTVRIPTALFTRTNEFNGNGKAGSQPKTAAEIAVSGIAAQSASVSSSATAVAQSLVDGSGSGGAGVKERKDAGKRPLIEEVVTPDASGTPAPVAKPAAPKSILKPTPPEPGSSTSNSNGAHSTGPTVPLDVSWNWEKDNDGKLRVTIHVPDLTAASITAGTTHLDVEPRRILLTLPRLPGSTSDRSVDIDRTLSDAQLVAKIHERARARSKAISTPTTAKSKAINAAVEELKEGIMTESDKEVTRMLLLKREREFDVDGARAQWMVKDRKLVITL